MLFPDNVKPLTHGGNLAAARLQFPSAPEPFIDLSTAINPHAYPIPPLAPEAFSRLPEPAAVERLCAAAAKGYGSPSRAHVVATSGTQVLLPVVAKLVPPGRAAVLATTYSEHARAAWLAGHDVKEVVSIEEMAAADLAIVANPNNPDGRIFDKLTLLALADALKQRNGVLVVDEAFMDVGPTDASLAGEVDHGNIVVLRSFGKFFGLAGVRLGFALAAPDAAAHIAAWFGPWAVSGPAIAIGEVALKDVAWMQAAREVLACSASRLDAVLTRPALNVVGGTLLFRLVQTKIAGELFNRLGRAGILARRFEEQPTWLRFGLPRGEEAWKRIASALA